MNSFKITNFDYNPLLKKILIDYCSTSYEDNAELDDNSLLMEFYYLMKNNELHLLFEVEKMSNYYQDLNK